MMDNVKKILTNLGQPDPCVTLDEAIYQLAKQVQWKIFSGRVSQSKKRLWYYWKTYESIRLKKILAGSEL